MGPTRAVVRLPRRGSPCPAPGARPCRGAAPRVPHCRPARAGTRDEWHEEAAGRRGSTRLSPEDSAWETPGTSSFEAGPPAPRTLSPDRLEVIRAEDADRARRVAARVPGAVGRPTAGLSSEHKARISAALKGRSVNGSTLSAEHKANIAKGMRWLMDNTDHGAKLGKGHKCTLCKQEGHNRRTCTAGQEEARVA